MKKALKVISLMLVAVLMVMSFVACGSKDDTATGSDTSKEAKTPAVKVIDVNLTDEEYAFGVDKNQPELLEKVNSFIAEIKANGTFFVRSGSIVHLMISASPFGLAVK